MDAFLLITPFLMLALVALLVFAGCVLQHATRATEMRVIVVIDFDPSVVTMLNITLTITRATSSGTALPTVTVTVSGPSVMVDTGPFTPTLMRGRGTRRIDLVRPPPEVNETWRLDCAVGINRMGSAAVQNGSATVRRSLTATPETFAFTIDTSSPTSVRVTPGFP
jgi:hypothetical protein